MKKIILFFLLLAALRAQPKYISLSSSQELIFNPPNPTVTNVRAEFRVTLSGAVSADQWIFNDNTMGCKIASGSTNVSCQDYADGGVTDNIVNTNLDMRVRVQRIGGSAKIFVVEIWPASGAISGYVYGQGTISSGAAFTFNNGQNNCPIGGGLFGVPNGGNIGFVRAYSNTLPLYSLPPAENPSSKGDLYDFEFQGSLADSSGRGLTLTLNTGSASYGNNVIYAPQASFRAYVTPPPVFYAAMPPTFRATQTITLDGGFAFDSQFDGGIPTLFWQQLSGPSIGTFSSRTAQQPTFSASLAGTYVVQLTAKDSAGAISATAVSVGATSTDSNGVVITPQGALWDKIMQAVTMAGTSPWPYFDLAVYDVAVTNATYGLSHYLPVLGSQIEAGTCTVTVTNGPYYLNGSGCHFTTDGLTLGGDCGDDGSTSCVLVGWTTVDGPGTGRLECGVQNIINDNQIECLAYDGAVAVIASNPTDSGYPIYFPGANSIGGDPWICGGNSANAVCIPYYDVALGLYREYYATGLSQFLTQARGYTDLWWGWGFDHGAGLPFPRATNIVSQTLRALDGHPERFGGVANGGPGTGGIFATMNWIANQDNFDVPGGDNREAGATQTYLGVLALADPDATRHAQYCAWLHTYTPNWISKLSASGYVGENIFGGSAPGYPYLNVSSAQPSAAPWRSMVFGTMGIAFSYLALSNPSDSACYNPTQAAQALNFVSQDAQAIYLVGRSTVNGGVFYNVNSQSQPNIGPGGGGFPGAGTVSATIGSNQVVGVSSAFTSQTDLCVGENFIGIAGGGANSTVYPVASCADDTHLTLAATYGTHGETSNVSGAQWSTAPPAGFNCGGGLAATCFNDIGAIPNGDVNLTRTPPGVLGWAYVNTSCGANCKSYGDAFFGVAFGGPADGPGGVLPCAGPGCADLQTDLTTTLQACNTLPPPCGGGSTPTNGKNFGEAVGFPSAGTYLAARLGGVQPVQPRTVALSFSMPANATSAVVTLTTPAGVISTAICNSSPCLVPGADARQSAVTLQVTFKNSTGSVIASGDPYLVGIN